MIMSNGGTVQPGRDKETCAEEAMLKPRIEGEKSGQDAEWRRAFLTEKSLCEGPEPGA